VHGYVCAKNESKELQKQSDAHSNKCTELQTKPHTSNTTYVQLPIFVSEFASLLQWCKH